MRRYLGIGRALLERGDEIARPEYHGGRTAKKVSAPMATSENVCCQLAAADLAFPPLHARCQPHRKVRKPWPMKWIVASRSWCLSPIYTYLTLHYRRPGARVQFPTRTAARQGRRHPGSSKAGYQRVTLDASRPADEPSGAPAATRPAPGGLPEDLRTTLIESPLLPLEVNSVTADAAAVSAIDCRLSDRDPLHACRQQAGALGRPPL